MKKILLCLCLFLTLTACGQTKTPATATPSPSSGEPAADPEVHWAIDLPEGRLVLRDGPVEGQGELALLTEKGERLLPLEELDQPPEQLSAQPFSDILGYSGFVLTVQQGGVGFALRSYYAMTEEGALDIARSFGYDGPQDYAADLDDDGAAEFVTNVMYGGDGVVRAYVYQRREDGVWRGDWDVSAVEELKTAGVTAYATTYDVQRELFVIQYKATEKPEPTLLETADLKDFVFLPYQGKLTPLEG